MPYPRGRVTGPMRMVTAGTGGQSGRGWPLYLGFSAHRAGPEVGPRGGAPAGVRGAGRGAQGAERAGWGSWCVPGSGEARTVAAGPGVGRGPRAAHRVGGGDPRGGRTGSAHASETARRGARGRGPRGRGRRRRTPAAGGGSGDDVPTATVHTATVHAAATAGIRPEPIRCSHRDDPDRMSAPPRTVHHRQTEERRSHENTGRLVPRVFPAGTGRIPSGREEG
jgi:hypothetical protein